MMTVKYTMRDLDGEVRFMRAGIVIFDVCKRASVLHRSVREVSETDWKAHRATFHNLDLKAMNKAVWKGGDAICGPCNDAIHLPERQAKVSNSGGTTD